METERSNPIRFATFLDFYNAIDGYTPDQIEEYLLGKRKRSRGTPKAHIDLANWLEDTQDNPRRILQGYRHIGKSFIISLYTAWRLFCDPNDSILIISAQSGIASQNVAFIKNLFEKNPLTEHLIGGDEGWKSDRFSVQRPTPALHASCKMLSLEGKITGNHGKLLIGDDIEVPDNCLTEKSRQFIRQRCGEFSKMGDCQLLVGTPHHEDSIYDYLESEKGYTKYKIPVLKDGGLDEDGNLYGEPMCPEMGHDMKWIDDKLRESYTTGEFASQYLLKSVSFSKTLIDVEDLVANKTIKEDILVQENYRDPDFGFMNRYFICDELINQVVIYYDPAFGLEGGDDSVLAVVAKTEKGNVYFLDCVLLSGVNVKTLSFEGQMREIVQTCQKYMTNRVVVERNFSPTLTPELNRVAAEMKVPVSPKPIVRTQNKQLFMAQMIEPLCKVGRLYVHDRVWKKSPFKVQLEALGSAKKDDCTDALAGAINELFPTGLKFLDYTDPNVIGNYGMIYQGDHVEYADEDGGYT